MTALRYLVRLYTGQRKLSEKLTNFNIKDDAVLRGLLEEMVEASEGTLKLDLSRFRLVIHRPGPGRVLARVRVEKSGKTTVTSRGK